MNILLLEDNENIREAVASFLQLEEYEVIDVGSIKDAKSHVKDKIDLYLLDVMLPDGSGYILAKEIRSVFNTPIIFLTAKESESERIKGFELGCDDYITKPFSLKELSLRITAVLRRYSKEIKDVFCEYFIGEEVLSIDKASHKLLLSDKVILLTPTEWSILLFLVDNSHRVLSKEVILESCLGYTSDSSERVVITHMKNIREKLGEEKWIETVRGFGYRFIGEERVSSL